VQVTPHEVVFELCSPATTLRLSEVLKEFELVMQGRSIYSGRAVVRNFIEAGGKTICEATLDAAQWVMEGDSSSLSAEKLAGEFKSFLSQWEKFYKIAPEFKVVTADMQAFLHELKCWLDKVELNTRTVAEPLRTHLQSETLEKAAPSIVRAIDAFIEQFEVFAATLADWQHPLYQSHLRRNLHPLILVSPFARRAYTKPLGYAGDYGMVNMMLHPAAEGDTLFAKAVNLWLLGQAPAQAHRNRVALLEKQLLEETLRVRKTGTVAKVLNLGCGPAEEVQRFLGTQSVHHFADFTLVDFNEETLEYVRRIMKDVSPSLPMPASVRLVRKSVLQILKDRGRSLLPSSGELYDYIYCAGLFDYLQRDVCKQIMAVFYAMLAPGGLLLATNATETLNSSRPFRFSMEYLLDWHLIYRDRDEFLAVVPDDASPENVAVSMEGTGVNLFLKIRKPVNANNG
jgi:extracellular factor (EF) 3-hydroxypalmitic acid methyl ester biosynthesis protein